MPSKNSSDAARAIIERMRPSPFAAALAIAIGCIAAPTHAATRVGPVEVDAALMRAKVPPESVVALVQEVGSNRTRLAWQPDVAVNPASLMKIVTTAAA